MANSTGLRSIAVFTFFVAFNALTVSAQKLTIQSPNQKIIVSLYCQQSSDTGEWYLTASYNDNGRMAEAIPRIDLGLLRSDQDFSKALKLRKAGKPV